MQSLIDQLASTCHKQARAAGWWDEYDAAPEEYRKYMLATHVALQHSELSEALEGLRKGKMDDHLPDLPAVVVEYADALIRILDTCGALGLPIGEAFVRKLHYNAERADHKPENRKAPGGKSF